MIHINIDRKTSCSLSRQIYDALKEAILFGTIQPGEKLPSTRELAKYLNVARNVVIECYEQLAAEGYVYSKNGAGTYACDGVRFHPLEKDTAAKGGSNEKYSPQYEVSFRTGIPDLAEIPIKRWAQIYQRIALDIKPSQLDYQDPFGDYRLRTQLSLYLNRARGAQTAPKNILITNGAAQSFHLLCGLIAQNEYALVENPLSFGILHTLCANSVNMEPIYMDEQGMVTAALPDKPPKLIFTTPSHQFPTGVILPAGRRIEMIKYARRQNAYIVEDDYDSEFRFDGSPIQSMQFLDPQRVIYVGTFSKTLMPALRLGYMVVPDELCEKMREAKYVADLHSPILEQLVLGDFLERGLFERHIRKMRKLYLKKRNALVGSLRQSFGERVKISGAEAGLHFIAAFEGVHFHEGLMKKIEENGVQISAVSQHCLSEKTKSQYDQGLIFGYGNTTMEDIDRGVKILSRVIKGER
ncbi:HTH-type transcriptional regulatory protein GabR [Anaerotignum neopropionicum]|uniref:HTH-type transcriptional regulatory protein GabR n=1 Tax=Anaerotignum neopropionicum TaxID=36847 RepID=A0A136WG44_9FIRM|nr:PLP-dependent aminotransferase family protein [Anaerotignum neopropionicum]KXL53475.1 HTH-type transcriptional regulatory protein GabR [Anaerotignum neopropionicum]